MLLLSGELRCTMARELEAAYPGEGCGLMLGTFEGTTVRVRELMPAQNLAPDARSWYTLDPHTHLQAERRARELGCDVVGFYHSHPDAAARPSKHDLAHAWPVYVYVIVPVTTGVAGKPRAWRLDGEAFVEVAVGA